MPPQASLTRARESHPWAACCGAGLPSSGALLLRRFARAGGPPRMRLLRAGASIVCGSAGLRDALLEEVEKIDDVMCDRAGLARMMLLRFAGLGLLLDNFHHVAV